MPYTARWEVRNPGPLSLPLVLTTTFPLSWRDTSFTDPLGISQQPFPGVGTWIGVLPAGETLRWTGRGSPQTLTDRRDRLTLRAEDAFGGVHEGEWWVWVFPWRVYLPIVTRAPPGL